MSYPQSGTVARLRFNHRGGADADLQLLGVVTEKRIPGGVSVRVAVDQPTSLQQSDDAQRNGTAYPAQPLVIESALRPLVTSAAGATYRRDVRTLSVLQTSAGVFLPVTAAPAFSEVGLSSLTVVDYTLGATDTVSVTALGGAAVVLTEGTDFAAATDDDTTAENIRVALAAVGITATRAGAVLTITTPLDALASGDITAWTVVLGAVLTPALPAAGLVPKGRYNGFIPVWPTDPNGDVPNSGHTPAGAILRVRWTGTPILAESLGAVGATVYSVTLSERDIAPGSVVVTTEVGGNALILRDDGAGRIVGQELTGGASCDGTINYRTGEVVLTFSAVTTGGGNVLADFEHSCLYLPIDVTLEWDAQLAQG